jgi:uncharacterized protein (UPF0147 family)
MGRCSKSVPAAVRSQAANCKATLMMAHAPMYAAPTRTDILVNILNTPSLVYHERSYIGSTG